MPRFGRRAPIIAATAALVVTSIATTGCSRLRNHKGYIGEQVLVDSIQAGVDNRTSVQATLGRPTFESQFTRGSEPATRYYVSRNTRQFGFNRPTPVDQIILAVSFDQSGNVSAVDRIGLEQVASIDPYGEETPTLGQERGFLSQLFGNIGRVGAVGQGGSTADNPNGN